MYCTNTSTLCRPHEWHIINFYSPNDLTLGQFLETFCFSDKLRCSNPQCYKLLCEHERCFLHAKGKIRIYVTSSFKKEDIDYRDPNDLESIFTWASCKNKTAKEPGLTKLSKGSWHLSFGKFLELIFYNNTTPCSQCGAPVHQDHIRFFYFKNKLAVMEYEPIESLGFALPPIKLDVDNDKTYNLLVNQDLAEISELTNQVYKKLKSKVIEWKEQYGGLPIDEVKDLVELQKLLDKEKTSYVNMMDAERAIADLNESDLHRTTNLRK